MAAKPPAKGSKAGSKSKSSGKPPSKPKTPYKPKKRDEIKAKRPAADAKKKKKVPRYTDKQLGIPKLNMITPAGIEKPRGQKKGKVFVDDQESMMTILAMVNADKEGQIESKMIRQRQMEAIRDARQAEMEKRKAAKNGKLEETKDSLRKGRKRKSEPETNAAKPDDSSKKAKKRVSFG